MARFAAFRLDRLMFEYERSLFVRVARVADRISRCRRAQLLADEPAVRVMAIRALHESFLHPMVEGHIELRLLVEMTAVAELGLCFHQEKVIRAGMMRGMTTQTAQVVLTVSRARDVRVILPGSVALQAPLIHLLRGTSLKAKNRLGISRVIDVVACWAMAGFASLFGRSTTLVEHSFPVWGSIKVVVDIFVTRLAGLCADIIGWVLVRIARRGFFLSHSYTVIRVGRLSLRLCLS